MSLLEMAQAYPEMSVTIKLADLKAAALELAHQIRKDAENDRLRRDRVAGTPLVEASKVASDLDVSPTTLWRWGRAGILTPYKFGGKVYYRQADIEAIIEAHNDTKSNN